MKRAFFVLLLFIAMLFPAASYAQEIVCRGTVVDLENNPIDVVSIVIFNNKDTTDQVYANTFKDGIFEIKIPEKARTEYTACLLSMGFEDTYLSIGELNGKVEMRNKLLRVNDAVVRGNKDVKSEITNRGGVLYNVAKTQLSEIGTSAKLLNFIPGVSADNDGNVSVIGKNSAAVYVNDILVETIARSFP